MLFVIPGASLAFAAAVALAQPGGGTGAASSSQPSAVPVDRIVAVVNSEAITLRGLERRIELIERQMREQNIQVPPPEALQRQVLERMIVARAQMQHAREIGLKLDEAQLDRAMVRLAQDNGMTLAQFRERVERDGIPFAQLRAEIGEEIVFSRLRERQEAKVQVTEAEIDALIAERLGRPDATEGPEYHVAQILLRVPEQAGAEEVERQRKQAEEVLAQARGGADFGKLAAAFSQAPDAIAGGSLGFRTADRLPKLFVDAIAKLSAGEVSDIVRSPAGFHVLKLLERRDPKTAAAPAVRQTHARHILMRADGGQTEADVRRRLNEIRQRVQAGESDFAELARQYSVDGSADRGGDLGWIYPGDTVPEFERAMDELQPGQLSEPVRSPFGWHLIQVLERRTDEASPERLRAQARNVLRQRKADDAYQEWLRELRDRAYVEYRLDDR